MALQLIWELHAAPLVLVVVLLLLLLLDVVVLMGPRPLMGG